MQGNVNVKRVMVLLRVENLVATNEMEINGCKGIKRGGEGSKQCSNVEGRP